MREYISRIPVCNPSQIILRYGVQSTADNVTMGGADIFLEGHNVRKGIWAVHLSNIRTTESAISEEHLYIGIFFYMCTIFSLLLNKWDQRNMFYFDYKDSIRY